MIDSTAIEDRCGVCNGNGSTCTTVRKTFEESEGLGMLFSFLFFTLTLLTKVILTYHKDVYKEQV